jgi:polyhydroxyalkanoate synthase subunit PhaC
VKIKKLLNNTTDPNPKEQVQFPNMSILSDKYNQDLSEKIEKFTKLYYQNPKDIQVGKTAHEIVKETNLYRLLHYKPIFKNPLKTPILIVYALINKSYIFDLQDDKSWIRNLLSQGFDVFLIDWKPPTSNDKYVSFDDYVNEFIDDCVDIIRNEKSIEKLTLHGYCMGATMSVMYSTFYQHKIKNLVTLAPVIDTSKDTTVIGNFSRNLAADKIMSSLGNMPPQLLNTCFAALKPFKQGLNKYFALLEHVDDAKFVENFLRVEKWLYDIPPITGEVFKQWINDIYKNNLLIKNELKLGNKKVDLSKIHIPLLNVVAEEDHLVSPQCSLPLNNLVSSSDNRLMKFPTGHVGLIASSYSQINVLPRIGKWLFSRSI